MIFMMVVVMVVFDNHFNIWHLAIFELSLGSLLARFGLLMVGKARLAGEAVLRGAEVLLSIDIDCPIRWRLVGLLQFL